MAAYSGMCASDTAIATLLCDKCLCRSFFVTPSIPTGSYWGAAFQVQSHGTFLETLRVNLWEGQIASLAWAWDHGRVFQTAALFLFGLLIGRRGLFLKENLKFWNKVLCGALIAFSLCMDWAICYRISLLISLFSPPCYLS